MDDLIPFLIVIAISIVGAAVNKKKKRVFQDSIVEGEPKQRNDDLLSWMERLVDDRPEARPFFEAEPEEGEVYEEMSPVVPEKSKFEAFNSYSGLTSPDERKMMVEKEAPRVTPNEHEEDITKQTIKEGEIGKTNVRSEFDLKKAVVFSTLLNRKYT